MRDNFYPFAVTQMQTHTKAQVYYTGFRLFPQPG